MELDVRLSSPNLEQQGLPLASLAARGDTPHQHRNLIRDSIASLAQFGIHYRDADGPIITNTLKLLLHSRPNGTLLQQLITNRLADSNISFTIIGNKQEHTPYSHNHELHQWLKA